MPPRNATAPSSLIAAVQAIRGLCKNAFSDLEIFSGRTALTANSEIEQALIGQKSARSFCHFVPLRQQMVGLLTASYRRYFKVALAHPSATGGDPDRWAWAQLQPSLRAAFEWIREWYILACEGENQSVRRAGSAEFVPGGTVSLSIPTSAAPISPLTAWRAPAWLFEISEVYFGFGPLKTQHVPDNDSDEKLEEGHTRLLLKGARRVFLWELGAAIETVRNEETAAAGAIPSQEVGVQKRRTIKRAGWEQRLKLYKVILTILKEKPSLQGMKFCAELDKRHAPPLLDWVKSKQWQQGLTWKEAWNDPVLKPKIRRVRQEAQRSKL